jgi:hypothetical protein
MPILVEDLLKLLGRAVGSRNRNELIDSIRDWAEENSREASLGRETFNGYKTKAHTEAHWAVLLIIREYLHAHIHEMRDRAAANELELACRERLTSALTRKARFERNPGQEPKFDREEIDRNSGAYVIFRRESENFDMRHDLLVLKPSEGRQATRYAFLIGQSIVMRGHWHLFGSSLYISGMGYDLAHKPFFMTISFSPQDDVSGGVLTGLTTKGRDPVTMSVLVVKVDFDRSIFDVGDLSDTQILKEFKRAAPPKLTEKQLEFFETIHKKQFGKALDHDDGWFAQKILGQEDRFVSRIRGDPGLNGAISPSLLNFCKKQDRQIFRD